MRRNNIRLLLELLDIWEAYELEEEGNFFEKMADEQYELWLKIQGYRNKVRDDLDEKTNGGIVCDNDDGPCACGAWHKDGK